MSYSSPTSDSFSLRLFVATLWLLLCAPATMAQDISPQESRERIKKLQISLTAIYKSVPRSYGDNLEVESAQLVEATQRLDRIEKAILPVFSQAPLTLEAFERNLSKTRAYVAGAGRAHLCAQAVDSVVKSHATTTPATEEQMQALNAALSALTSDPAGFENTADWCRDKMEALVKERIVVVKEQETNKDKLQADLDAKNRREELDAAMQTVRLAKQDLDAALAASSGPLAPEALAGMRASANRVFSLDEKAGAMVLAEVQFYEAELAWRLSQNEGVAIIAGAMAADVASFGKGKGHRLGFSFMAQAGRCYAALMRFKTFTGDQKVEDFLFIAGKKGALGLQRFSIDNRSPTHQLGEGFCATDDVRVKAKAKVFAGKSNSVQYVVLSWEKEKMPSSVLASISMHIPDRCDTQTHKSLWLNPVPGSLAFIEDVPYLWTGSSSRLDQQSKLIDPTGQERQVVTGALKATPTAPLTTKLPFIFRGCARDGVDGPYRAKWNRCLAKVTKRYARKIEKAERRVKRAKSDRRLEKAESALAKVLEQKEEREDKKCGKIEDDIMLEVRAIHELLISRFASSPPSTTFDRIAYLQERNRLGL
ncbi:MAG: hypothetical protein GY822_29040 [Deltaproteobacteria bacterium]|nr:hypothetical protein [Deltaproteobacteria bacterium]